VQKNRLHLHHCGTRINGTRSNLKETIMSRQANYIVPPTFEAAILGFDCVEIGLRKAHLHKNGQRVLSATYRQAEAPKLARFSDWVQHIVNAQSA
jgi:hypothetical protein